MHILYVRHLNNPNGGWAHLARSLPSLPFPSLMPFGALETDTHSVLRTVPQSNRIVHATSSGAFLTDRQRTGSVANCACVHRQRIAFCCLPTANADSTPARIKMIPPPPRPTHTRRDKSKFKFAHCGVRAVLMSSHLSVSARVCMRVCVCMRSDERARVRESCHGVCADTHTHTYTEAPTAKICDDNDDDDDGVTHTYTYHIF